MTVDTRYTPIRNILQYVDGSRWVTEYYSQVLDKDSELSSQQTSLNPVYQQYRKISKFQLAVSTALDLQQNTETRQYEANGSATTLPGLIPNKGDMFLADIGDGQEGLFTVTDTVKLTHLKESLYSIDYVLVDAVGRGSERLKDLEEKVIQEFTFVRDYLAVGEKPIITSNEFTLRQDMIQTRKDLINRYMLDFYSREKAMLMIPGQGIRTYDPFLQTFARDMIDSGDHPFINTMRFPAVSAVPGMDAETLWDVIRSLSKPMLQGVVNKMGLVSVQYWKGQPHYAGVYYSGVERITYPIDQRADVDAEFETGCGPIIDGALQEGSVRRGSMELFTRGLGRIDGFTITSTVEAQLPYAVPVTSDPWYVFTQAFYESVGPFSSHLERLTHQMLSHEPLEKPLLQKIAREAFNWPDVERFYYIPVLLALLQVAIHTS